MAVLKVSGDAVSLGGATKNISSAGVLFTSSEPLRLGPIEYTITLPSDPGQALSIRCFGNVVRSVPADNDGAFDVAATLQRFEFVRDKMGE
jgi:hypothetical protein